MRRTLGFITVLALLLTGTAIAATPESITQCSPWGMLAILGSVWGLLKLAERWLPSRPTPPMTVIVESLPGVPAHDHDDRYIGKGLHDAEIKSLRESIAGMERNLGREIGQVKQGQDSIIELLIKGAKP